MFFVDHLFEIMSIGKALTRDGYCCDEGEAYDRFRADVRTGERTNTEGCLPDFDMKAASAQWNALNDGQKTEAYDDWHEFMDTHYKAACAAFAKGREACEALAEAWEAGK